MIRYGPNKHIIDLWIEDGLLVKYERVGDGRKREVRYQPRQFASKAHGGEMQDLEPSRFDEANHSEVSNHVLRSVVDVVIEGGPAVVDYVHSSRPVIETGKGTVLFQQID
jgi:hypothetical protein